ncbi:alpha/beta hydrolase [Sphingomonas morindae]|uniref:Alpha/beta hydrolase n=1 Tax=Sphingomonas morindae TaxID=1541170 RepID=A0ABY4X504_9SPHN|nr:alpha/beta hydrolase [Sphingomonas morindae]USI71973.1 alpha/beta hydrolase [Sphingomonas morindae]
MRRRLAWLAALACIGAAPAPPAEPVLPLWPGPPPGDSAAATPERIVDSYVHNVHRPSLTLFRADPRHANGVGIIVVPGGGHRMLVWMNEGVWPARTLNRAGITVFVLKYRLAREPGSPYSIEGDAAADARRAVRFVRAHAADYGVDPARIGLMGFSAGGELVSLAADNPAPSLPAGADAIDRVSARPDFQVLIYPGPLGIPARAAAGAPPAFLAAGSLDQCCATPTITLYQQLRAAGVSAELHLFADTDHGFNVAMHSERISIQHWPDRLIDWLSDGGWLTAGAHERRPPAG